MVNVPWDPHHTEPGVGWNHTKDSAAVSFRCPAGHYLLLFNPDQLAPRHGIAEDGTVDGSVVCQGRSADPCSFHEHVRLLDWDGGSIARL